MVCISQITYASNGVTQVSYWLRYVCTPQDEEEEAEPEKPVKAERPSSRDYANAQKKTNLRSEDDTFKVQEEQRYTMTLCVLAEPTLGTLAE